MTHPKAQQTRYNQYDSPVLKILVRTLSSWQVNTIVVDSGVGNEWPAMDAVRIMQIDTTIAKKYIMNHVHDSKELDDAIKVIGCQLQDLQLFCDEFVNTRSLGPVFTKMRNIAYIRLVGLWASLDDNDMANVALVLRNLP